MVMAGGAKLKPVRVGAVVSLAEVTVRPVEKFRAAMAAASSTRVLFAWSDTITFEICQVPASLSFGKVIVSVPVLEAAGAKVESVPRFVPPEGLWKPTYTEATPEAAPPISPASVALKFTITSSDAEVVLIEPLKVNAVRLGGVVSTAEVTVNVPRLGKAALTASGVARNSKPVESSTKT